MPQNPEAILLGHWMQYDSDKADLRVADWTYPGKSSRFQFIMFELPVLFREYLTRKVHTKAIK